MLERQNNTPIINEITKEKIQHEKAYLAYLCSLYEVPIGHLDFIAHEIAKQLPDYLAHVLHIKRRPEPPKKNPLHARISKFDFERIKSLLHLLEDDNFDDPVKLGMLKKEYEANSDQFTGLPPAWANTPLYEILKTRNLPLPKEKKSFIKRLIQRLFDWFDNLKRLTDLAEDSISSAIRMPGIAKIPEHVVQGAVGGFNLGNTSFEFLKGIWNFWNAYISDAEFRAEHTTDAAIRVVYGAIGITVCGLYIGGFLLTWFALAGIAMATMPIFVVSFFKNYHLVSVLEERYEQSKTDKFREELEALETNLKEMKKKLSDLIEKISDEHKDKLTEEELKSFDPKKTIPYQKLYQEYLEKEYQLFSMKYRIAIDEKANDKKTNDERAFREAKKEMIMSGVELFGYIFIAAGAIIAFAIFISPVGPFVASIGFAATVMGVAIVTICKFTPPTIDLAISLFEKTDNYFENKISKFFKGLFSQETLEAKSTDTLQVSQTHDNLTTATSDNNKIVQPMPEQQAEQGNPETQYVELSEQESNSESINIIIPTVGKESVSSASIEPLDNTATIISTPVTTSITAEKPEPKPVSTQTWFSGMKNLGSEIASSISSFSLHGKGKHYWSALWDEGWSTTDTNKLDKAYKLLERYAHLSATTHGKAVYNQYYKGKIPQRTNDCSAAVDLIADALGSKSIKKNGDLHQILQVFAEKDGKDYLERFNVEDRLTFKKSSSTLFQPAKSMPRITKAEKQELLKKYW